MTKRHPKTLKRGVMVTRKFNPRVHESMVHPPSYVAQESQQEFVPDARLIRQADFMTKLRPASR